MLGGMGRMQEDGSCVCWGASLVPPFSVPEERAGGLAEHGFVAGLAG